MTSQKTRLIRLLDRGFYPAELPPPFATKRFSDVRASFQPPNGYAGSTLFFDGATFKGHLRKFGVINPANYFLVSRFISERWADISSTFDLSSCSGTRPKFPARAATGRAIHSASLASKRKGQAHLASMYPVILSLDINRFYGSIYTHSIPWAALGKEPAKAMFANNTLSSHWSASLDRFTRNCNQRQTIGLPIGPDTSRIISEMILSRLDKDLTTSGSGLASSQVYHNIDDYQFGCFNVQATENAQSLFVRTITKYELRLNDFKTSINHGLDFHPSNFQRFFDILGNVSGRNFVEHFFEILYQLDGRYPQVNVIGYALKRFARTLARNAEKELVREYLQRLIFAAPHQARWVFPLLLGFYKGKPPNNEIRRLIHWGIEVCSRRNDVGSLLWFIYAAIFLEVRVSGIHCGQCIGIGNGLVDLMLYHGRSKGIFTFNVNRLRQRYANSRFHSDAWLPLYEIGRRAWDVSASFSKIGGPADPNNLYAHLMANNVEFYMADQQYFAVEAFDGWNLSQGYFDGVPLPQPIFDLDDHIDEWENYE